MPVFSVDFFKEDDGTKPVGIFIRSLETKMKAKVVAGLHLLEECGKYGQRTVEQTLGGEHKNERSSGTDKRTDAG